ncbi:hypothetical protein IPM19_04100 [bacterium]|nr:MAG: hypothetical protein IPM19_04100 [bacterium]
MEILKKNGHLSAQENVTPKPSQNKPDPRNSTCDKTWKILARGSYNFIESVSKAGSSKVSLGPQSSFLENAAFSSKIIDQVSGLSRKSSHETRILFLHAKKNPPNFF